MGDVWSWGVYLYPLSDEVGQGLRLDGGAGDVLDVVAHELECPFGDLSCSVAAVDDLPKWERGDDNDLMVSERVLQLLSRHEHGIGKPVGVIHFLDQTSC
jgi:hypothetical protein